MIYNVSSSFSFCFQLRWKKLHLCGVGTVMPCWWTTPGSRIFATKRRKLEYIGHAASLKKENVVLEQLLKDFLLWKNTVLIRTQIKDSKWDSKFQFYVCKINHTWLQLCADFYMKTRLKSKSHCILYVYIINKPLRQNI